jgi:long-chain acyl-CoA synthetase
VKKEFGEYQWWSYKQT